MKSVYIDDVLHSKLKRLAGAQRQTLIALLNRVVQDGLARLEPRRRPRSPVRDPVAMFGRGSHREVEVEQAYGDTRYQGAGERNGRF